MLQVETVFQLVIDRLDNAALAEHQLVKRINELFFHAFFQGGDELNALGGKLFGQVLGDVAPVAKQLAEQPLDQLGDRLAVVGVAWRDAERHNAAPVVDHKVQLEAVEPARGGLAPTCFPRESPVPWDADVLAHAQRSRVDEGDALGGVAATGHERGQRHQQFWN